MEIRLLASPLPEWAVREDIESQMCELIYAAMMEVLPDNLPKEESDTLWRQSFKERLQGGTCHILFFHKGVLRGYLSYLVRPREMDVYLEDVIIHPLYQGDGITIRALLSRFADIIGRCKYDVIRTYANRANTRSNSLLAKIGFVIEQPVNNGHRYTISKTKLLQFLQRLV